MKSNDYPGKPTPRPAGMVGIRRPARVAEPMVGTPPSAIDAALETNLPQTTPEPLQALAGEVILRNETELRDIEVASTKRSPYQPRLIFDEQALEELANSIQTIGLAKPILVRPLADGTYELVGGERRWRAVQILGWQTVPAIVKPMSDAVAMIIALTDNEQEDLTDYERAKAYHNVIEAGEISSQRALARNLGVNVSIVSRCLALMSLPEEAREVLDKKPGLITLNYAAQFVEHSQKNPEMVNAMVKRMAEEGIQQVQALRLIAAELSGPPKNSKPPQHRTYKGLGTVKISGRKLQVECDKTIDVELFEQKLNEFMKSLNHKALAIKE
ncbi:TPA: ParB/RepB/Spo0J family partition protein [Pseudomonas aeruginosa]